MCANFATECLALKSLGYTLMNDETFLSRTTLLGFLMIAIRLAYLRPTLPDVEYSKSG